MPVVPVRSTARTDPPSARQVPTFRWVAADDPAASSKRPVPAKAGDPATDARLSDPVLKTALSEEELSAGTDVGAVTPGNPVTPVQVPMGSGTTPFWAGGEAGDVAVPPPDGTPAVVPGCPVPGAGAEPVADVWLVEDDGLVVTAPDPFAGELGAVVAAPVEAELGAEVRYATADAARASQAGGANWVAGGGVVVDPDAGEDGEPEGEDDDEGEPVAAVSGVDEAGIMVLATRAGGVVPCVVPEMAAGAASPPAVARLATMPRTTEPFPGAPVAEATTA